MAVRKRKTVAAFELVDFPLFGMAKVRAKIDTGAFTGALHCTQISEEQTPDGPVLRFSPFDKPELHVVEKDYVTSYVRSSNGKRQKRYFIKTQIVVQGLPYGITLSLADRSEMKSSVLIGRRFLRRYSFLVDVRKSSEVS